ncbi:tRNA (adenosine(37)-N6)-dimethylallyltransferase MiaA [Salibacterium salarium]|uniref:tRNA dimethylallyltransferase n=1 Tax=Salibacterium salarium TaxID=284579 RepID=A0A3R9Q459_9BACI|nr:tRNA (adenosine(37)-N6)-dimethylallyltransferase MiaA [Salibacterium salarium]RSL33243.1 tRNA (adenosine(37)-N6)-dimethylallyltransferase MiaA [Salibacterium salarium]
MSKDKVIVIAGPTAVGKSEVGMELSKYFQGEVISGDSMQIYKGLDIGTAKVTKEERNNIPHHFVDELTPAENYSAADFKQAAEKKIRDINQHGKIPFIVGGTGFYIRSVTRGLEFQDTPSDESFRREMEHYAEEKGAAALHEKLKNVDQESARVIHPNNIKKVIRALEIQHLTGQKKQSFTEQEDKESPYDLVMIGLTMEREKLYARINQRVDNMVAEGIIEEARWLFDHFSPESQAAQAIGYKEFFPYFRGEYSMETAVFHLKKNSRHYAKRQLTWFRNKEDVEWFDMTNANVDEKIQKMIRFIEGNYYISSNSNK